MAMSQADVQALSQQYAQMQYQQTLAQLQQEADAEAEI